MKPWNKLSIKDCLDPLVSIPTFIYKFEPHPYLSLGAPYGQGVDPWRLRKDVSRRLILAQQLLQSEDSTLQLAVFDAWRPIAVQKFMVDHVINEHCLRSGINPQDKKHKLEVMKICEEVSKFWASPSSDPAMPPPHSTGAAIDLTLVTTSYEPLNMGSEIDVVGDISRPDYYCHSDHFTDKFFAIRSHSRRTLLAKIMNRAGFIQHPYEWWHFSFGDQLWAWRNNSSEAIYGVWPAESNSFTA